MYKNESTGRTITDSQFKALTPAHRQQYAPYKVEETKTAKDFEEHRYDEENKQISQSTDDAAEDYQKKHKKDDDQDEEDEIETSLGFGLSNFESGPRPDLSSSDSVGSPDFGGFEGGDGGGGGAGADF